MTWKLQIRASAHEDFNIREPLPLKSFSGGPRHLLLWLEQQLGLPDSSCSMAARVLDAAQLPSTQATTAFNRYRELQELLRIRDAFVGEFPDEDASKLPWLAELLTVKGAEEDRWLTIRHALDGGAKLPAHELRIAGASGLPAVVQQVLQRLNVVAEAPAPVGNWEFLRAAMPGTAMRYVAAKCSPADDIVAEGGRLALGTELSRRGYPVDLPDTVDVDHPARAVLPTLLRLMLGPTDVYLLHDLLTMQGGPVSAATARPLVGALQRAASTSSAEWQDAVRTRLEFAKEPHVGEFVRNWVPLLGSKDTLSAEDIETAILLVENWVHRRYAHRRRAIRAFGNQAEVVRAHVSLAEAQSLPLDFRWTSMVAAHICEGANQPELALVEGAPRVVNQLSLAAHGRGKIWVIGACSAPQPSRLSAPHLIEIQQILGLELGNHHVEGWADELTALVATGGTWILVGDQPLPTWASAAEVTSIGELDTTFQPAREPVQLAGDWNVGRDLRPDHLRGSKLKQLVECPRRVALSAAFPAGTSKRLSRPAAMMGTVIHKALETMLNDGTWKDETDFEARIREAAAEVGQPLQRPEEIMRQVEGARNLEEAVQALRGWGPDTTRSEVSLNGIVDGIQVSGTADLIAQKDGKTVVVDLKNGGNPWEWGAMKARWAAQLYAYQQMADADEAAVLSAKFGRFDTQSDWLAPSIVSRTKRANGEEFGPNLPETITRSWQILQAGRLPAWPRISAAERKGMPEADGFNFYMAHAKRFKDPEPCKYCSLNVVCGKEVPK